MMPPRAPNARSRPPTRRNESASGNMIFSAYAESCLWVLVCLAIKVYCRGIGQAKETLCNLLTRKINMLPSGAIHPAPRKSDPLYLPCFEGDTDGRQAAWLGGPRTSLRGPSSIQESCKTTIGQSG